MPTTTFPVNDSHVVTGGQTVDQTAVGRQGRFLAGNGADVEFTFTGTQLVLSAYWQSTGQLAITLDGTTTTPTTTTGAWITYTVGTGLADTTHTVVIKSTVSGGLGGPVIDFNGAFQVTGSAPSLSLPSGFGNNTVLSVGTTAYIITDGSQGATVSSQNNDNCYAGSSAGGASPQHTGHGCLRFFATTSYIAVWGYLGGDQVSLVVDDNLTTATTTTLPNTSTWGWYFFTGLDGANQHQYMILGSAFGSAGSTYYWGLNAASFNTSTPTARETWAFLGDSIAQDTSTSYVASWIERSCILTKRGFYVAGIAGNCVDSGGSGTPMKSRTTDVTSTGAATPTDIVVEGGVNDASSGTTAATIQQAYYNLANTITTALPTVRLHLLLFFETTNPTATGLRPSYLTAMQNAAGSVGDGLGHVLSPSQQAQIDVVDTTGWWTTSNSADGTHPNPTGQAQLSAAFVAQYPGAVTVTMDSLVWLEDIGSIRSDLLVPAESLLSARADAASPLEALVIARMDIATPIEGTGSIRRDAGLPLESSTLVQRDSGSPLESVATQRADARAPIDATGSTIVTMDAGCPIETLAGAHSDATALIDSLFPLQRDTRAYIDSAIPVVVTMDAGLAIESLAALRIDAAPLIDTPGPVIVPRYGNRPSRNALRDTVNTFKLINPNQDADGSLQDPWTPLGINVRCSIQPHDQYREERGAAWRQITEWKITFGGNPGLGLGDQVQWTDFSGTLHTIIVVGTKDMAGRGAVFLVTGKEVI